MSAMHDLHLPTLVVPLLLAGSRSAVSVVKSHIEDRVRLWCMAFTTSDTLLVVLLFSKRVLTRWQNRAEGGGCRQCRLPTTVL